MQAQNAPLTEKAMQVRGWAVAWYRKEDWPGWRRLFPDFPDYEAWLKAAESGFLEDRDRGAFPEKIYIEPKGFEEWCRSTGSPLNGRARKLYAISLLTEKKSPSSN
jgi:hypothetical protein